MAVNKTDSTFYPFRSEEAKKEYMSFYKERTMKWPVEYEEKMISTSFGKTYVRICGPTDGKPLLLMHGGGDNSSSWAPNIEPLSKCYRVYAIDLINAGNRSICTKPVNNLKDIMDWMNELQETIGITQKINIVSMSYGAYLSARYALQYPDRVEKVVLMAPPNFAIPNSGRFVLGVLSTILPGRHFTSKFFYWCFKDLAKFKGDYGKQVIETFIDNALLIKKCYTFQKFINPKVFTIEELKNFSVPVYYMIGEHDINYFAEKAVKYLNEIAPGIKTELFTDSGHDLPILLAAEVNQKITEFLEG